MDNQLQTQGQSDVLSLDEAAEQLGVSRKGLNSYLMRHPELKEKYLNKDYYDGRRRYVLKIEALPFIVITRNVDSKNLHGEGFSKGKEKLAKQAIARQNQSEALLLMKEMIEKQGGMIEKQGEMIETLTGILKNHGIIKPIQLQLPTTEEKPPELNFRQKITQRVNAYAKEKEIEHKDVRGRLYYEFSLRYRCNLRARANRLGISQIDVIAAMEMLKEAWILACNLFKLKEET
jgi:biotin operon repressor